MSDNQGGNLQNLAEKNAVLTPRQKRAIAALMESRTISDAAVKAKVSERSIYTWLNDPIFKLELLQAENAITDATTRRLTDGAKHALDTLLIIMKSRDVPYGLQLSAAKAWLDTFLKARDLSDFERRLTALEAKGQLDQ